MPYQGPRSEDISRIEVFKEFEERLQNIGGFSHIIVIYWFHEWQRYHLLVRTPCDDIPHSLFATRSPYTSCPPGLTVLQSVASQKNILKVKGLDGIDTSPLLDVNPYVAAVDQRSVSKLGWLEGKPGR